MSKTGIFGGTFDPIHKLHLRISLSAKSALKLDKIIMVPTGHPPHKDNDKVSSFEHRIKMVELAIQNLQGFSVSDIENQRGMKKSYTSDTLDYFAEKYPQDELFFIVGSDSLFDIENWKNPQNIFNKAEIVVFHRPNISSEAELHRQMDYLRKKYRAKITQIEIASEAISSTDIRSELKGGNLSIHNLPSAVKQYIKDHKLYE